MSTTSTPLGAMSALSAGRSSSESEESAISVAVTARQVDAHVGQRVRERREALGMSQGRLGRHLGLTFSQVQKYEKGSNRIGAGRLYLLAVLLQVPVQFFFKGLGQNPATKNESGQAMKRAETAVLYDAIQSISDCDTRRALLSLASSLADSEVSAEGVRCIED